MQISDVETPALIIDVDIMERNLRRMADYTRQHNLRLRPHTKTHKIPYIGRRQLDLVTCRREIVSADAASGIRVFPLDGLGVG